jgi:hypothetical protein
VLGQVHLCNHCPGEHIGQTARRFTPEQPNRWKMRFIIDIQQHRNCFFVGNRSQADCLSRNSAMDDFGGSQGVTGLRVQWTARPCKSELLDLRPTLATCGDVPNSRPKRCASLYITTGNRTLVCRGYRLRRHPCQKARASHDFERHPCQTGK